MSQVEEAKEKECFRLTKQHEQEHGTRGKNYPSEEQKRVLGGIVQRAAGRGETRLDAGQGRAREPRGAPQGQREPPQMFGQESELTGAALRKTPLGAAAEGVEGSHLGWAAVALGGGQLTCLVLFPVPCVPVAHE